MGRALDQNLADRLSWSDVDAGGGKETTTSSEVLVVEVDRHLDNDVIELGGWDNKNPSTPTTHLVAITSIVAIPTVNLQNGPTFEIPRILISTLYNIYIYSSECSIII